MRDTDGSGTFHVLSLVCHAHVKMATQSLLSLIKYCQEPIDLTLLDDGSLDEDDVTVLRSLSDRIHVTRKCELDAIAEPKLRAYPALRKFRQEHVFGIKLIDVMHLGLDHFLLCDSDIQFLRPFVGLKSETASYDMVFMREWRDTYSVVYRDRYLRLPMLRMPEGLNAGLLYVSKRAYDLDRLEWFLSNPRYRVWPTLVEQSAWALLAGGCRAGQWSPYQVSVPTTEPSPADPAIAYHYLGEYRSLFGSGREHDPHELASKIRIEPAEYLSVVSTTWRRLRRRLGRTRNNIARDRP